MQNLQFSEDVESRLRNKSEIILLKHLTKTLNNLTTAE